MKKLIKRVMISSMSVLAALTVLGGVFGGNLGASKAEASYRDRDHDRYKQSYDRKDFDHRCSKCRNYRDHRPIYRQRDYYPVKYYQHYPKKRYNHDRDYRSPRYFSRYDRRNDVDIDANTGKNDISYNTLVGDVETGDIDIETEF